MIKTSAILCTCILFLFSTACAQNEAVRKNSSELGRKHVFEKEKIPYLVSTPENYSEDKDALHPTILFLHGGDRSNTRHHPKKYAKKAGIDFPFIVIAPHCTSGCSWGRVDFASLLDEVGKEYRIDKSRVYITGYSMGGYGTWSAISRFPDLFAAAAPLAGGGNEKTICKANKLPIRAYHGDKDNVIPHSESVKLVSALKKCDGNAELTTIEGGNHGIWMAIFQDAKFFEWLLQHKT